MQAFDYNKKWNIDFFEKALINNHPTFVDYFLRRQHNVLETKDYIELKKENNEKIKQISSTSIRATTLSTSIIRGNQTTSLPDNNEDETSPVDDDDKGNRAISGQTFIIKKLYANPIDHLQVLILIFI
jgi:hypothetical protein